MNRGVALVSVVLGLAILVILALTASTLSRTETLLVRNHGATTQARHAADAAVRLAVQALLEGSSRHAVRVDGAPFSLEFGAASVTVAIQDSAGLIDLNQAPPTLMAGLALRAGANVEQAAQLVAAIFDWRDSDDLPAPFGAEATQYRAAGRRYVPRNGPFETLAELELVLGMTPELYRRMAPALTVHSHLPGIDPAVVPAAVLRALPGITETTVLQALAERPPALAMTASEMPSALAGFEHYFAASPHHAFVISAEARLLGGFRFRRIATVWLGDDRRRPWQFVTWAQGD